MPDLSVDSVVCEPLRMLREPLRIESFDRLHDPTVENTPPLSEKTLAGHLVRERVRRDGSGLFELRKPWAAPLQGFVPRAR